MLDYLTNLLQNENYDSAGKIGLIELLGFYFTFIKKLPQKQSP